MSSFTNRLLHWQNIHTVLKRNPYYFPRIFNWFKNIPNNMLGMVQNWMNTRIQEKNNIFKDIVQIGGREVNPISKNLTKVGEGGAHKTYCQKL